MVPAGVLEVRGRTVIASDTTGREVDTIILGTGFELLPPPISARIVGRDQRTLADVWAAAPDHYHAVEVAGFPNYFRGSPAWVARSGTDRSSPRSSRRSPTFVTLCE